MTLCIPVIVRTGTAADERSSCRRRVTSPRRLLSPSVLLLYIVTYCNIGSVLLGCAHSRSRGFSGAARREGIGPKNLSRRRRRRSNDTSHNNIISTRPAMTCTILTARTSCGTQLCSKPSRRTDGRARRCRAVALWVLCK